MIDAALLFQASTKLREMAYAQYERYTENSLTPRSDWSYEEKCIYGDKEAYELSEKLLDEYNKT
jgi:hypothetical protein